MSMFDTFNRTGEAEFPFPKSIVFKALCEAVDGIRGMTVEHQDALASRLDIKTGMSAFSWGEKVSVTVSSKDGETAVISVGSGAKTIFGSATAHGKNRENVRQILVATSEVLGRRGAQWRAEMPVAPSVRSSVADELMKLAALRDQGVLTVEEFSAQKQALLGK